MAPHYLTVCTFNISYPTFLPDIKEPICIENEILSRKVIFLEPLKLHVHIANQSIFCEWTKENEIYTMLEDDIFETYLIYKISFSMEILIPRCFH